MKNEEKRFITPKIYDAGGNLKKRWFIYYYFKNPNSQKLERKRVYLSRNSLVKKERYSQLKKLVDNYTTKLYGGWTPFGLNDIQSIQVAEAIHEAVETKRGTTAPKSYNTYRKSSSIFIDWLEANKLDKYHLIDFQKHHAVKYLNYLSNERVNTKTGVRGLGAKTVNNHRNQLRTLFNNIIDQGIQMRNPFKDTPIRKETQNIEAFNDDELDLLMNYMEKNTPEMFSICQFIYYCFIRPSELIRLKVEDIDLENFQIRIPAEVSKNSTNLIVKIPEPFRDHVIGMKLDTHPANYYIFGHGMKPHPLCVGSARKIQERYLKIREHLGIEKPMYSLKHTGVKKVANNPFIPMVEIKNQLRHHSLDMVQKYLNAFKSQASENLAKNFPAFGSKGKKEKQLQNMVVAESEEIKKRLKTLDKREKKLQQMEAILYKEKAKFYEAQLNILKGNEPKIVTLRKQG